MTADLERLRERLTELSDRRSAFDIGHYWNACEEAEQAITALLAEVEQLRNAVAEAEIIINRGVELMTTDQVGQWTGVRHWLETQTIDAAQEEK